MHKHTPDNSERGVATLEFALTASFFFMMILVVIVGAHLLWIHNSLVEATRRGARYAANQCNPIATCPGSSTAVDRITNVVLYDSPTAGTTPIVPGLHASNVTVHFSDHTDCATCADFGVANGTVSVKIQNYNYNLTVLANTVLNLPPYQTTVAGENAGFVPADK